MDYFLSIKDIESREIVPGFHARMAHTKGMTIAHWTAAAGEAIPEHQHVQEQITKIISGELEVTINGESKVCTAADFVLIPSNAPHSAKALTDCVFIDVFQPVREEYK